MYGTLVLSTQPNLDENMVVYLQLLHGKKLTEDVRIPVNVLRNPLQNKVIKAHGVPD